MKEFEKIFLDLARLRDPVRDSYKVGWLLRSFLQSFSFIAVILDSYNLDLNSVKAIEKSEMNRRQDANPKTPERTSLPMSLSAISWTPNSNI